VAPGVRVVDDRAKNYLPMPVDASRPGWRSGREHPQGSQRPHGSLDLDVCRGAPERARRSMRYNRGAIAGEVMARADVAGLV